MGVIALPNPGFEAPPTFVAATTTNNRWVNGQAAGGFDPTGNTYGWSYNANAGSGKAQYDTTNVHSGSYSFKLSTTATASWVFAGCALSESTTLVTTYGIHIQPNTVYSFTFYMKTTAVSGAATTGAFLSLKGYNSAGVSTQNTSSTGINTTTSMTKYTMTWTSASTSAFIIPEMNVRGNNGTSTLVMDAWFDDFSLTSPSGNVLLAF